MKIGLLIGVIGLSLNVLAENNLTVGGVLVKMEGTVRSELKILCDYHPELLSYSDMERTDNPFRHGFATGFGNCVIDTVFGVNTQNPEHKIKSFSTVDSTYNQEFPEWAQDLSQLHVDESILEDQSDFTKSCVRDSIILLVDSHSSGKKKGTSPNCFDLVHGYLVPNYVKRIPKYHWPIRIDVN